jgi:hypothetical protein
MRSLSILASGGNRDDFSGFAYIDCFLVSPCQFSAWEMDFSAFYSTLAAAALADLVFSRYEIDVPKNCQFWHRGLK